MNLLLTKLARDHVDENVKKNNYTLKSFPLIIFAKTISNSIMEHSFKPSPWFMFSRQRRSRSFAEDGKEIYQKLSQTCTAIIVFIKHFVSDVPVAVVCVFFNSLRPCLHGKRMILVLGLP